MTTNTEFEVEDFGAYQVHSRREIISLLRSIGEHNQLVRMIFRDGAEAIVTSILQVDDVNNLVILDCAPAAVQNQRILESDNISFETVLEHIRILFFANQVESCIYENLPAFQMALPASLIRLQRREFYRVPTPISSPVHCTVRYEKEAGEGAITVVSTLQNVSGGGIAMIDEKKLLDNTIGKVYPNCRVDFPGGAVVVTLQIRNSQDVTLSNGKAVRRLGCLFMEMPQSMAAVVQRYITKLERDQNAKATGMG